MRVCNVPGCGTLYPNNEGGRCPEHRRQARAARRDNRVYDTPEHRAFRTAVIQRDPICVLCGLAPSTVADHYPHSRRDLVDAGLNPNNPAHGRGLCSPCHNASTARHQPGGWANPNTPSNR